MYACVLCSFFVFIVCRVNMATVPRHTGLSTRTPFVFLCVSCLEYCVRQRHELPLVAYILSVRSTQWLAHFIVCVCVCVWSSCKYGHSTPVRRSEHIYCLCRYVRVCILLLSDMSICRVCHSLSFVCIRAYSICALACVCSSVSRDFSHILCR